MKNRNRMALMSAMLLLLAVVGVVVAQTSNKNYKVEDSNVYFREDVSLGGEVQFNATAVSLTSPTVTFSVEGANLVVLNSDANQVAAYPTNGELYQRITILSGAGSNTIRFDDGAKTILGANKTVTEGQGDTLELICTSTAGDVWSLVSDGTGN